MDDGSVTGTKSLDANGTLIQAGDNGTVIYVYVPEYMAVIKTDKQKVSVSYVDDTTRKTLKTDSISGTTGSKSSYSTSGNIADYKKHGYELVTDGYPADLTFDNNDTTDQNFTVHLKHHQTPVNPTDPQTPGAPINPDEPDGPKWPTSTNYDRIVLRNVFIQCRSLKMMKLPLPSFLSMCMLSTIGREFIVHWATRPPYKLKLQHLRAKWPPDLMLSRVQISY